MALTPKQDRFCEEYLVDLIATQAAIRAGYSAKTAEAQGSRLLSNVKVAERIAALKAARSERTEITADMVLRELALIGFSDVKHFAVTDFGRLDTLDGAPEQATRAVASVKHKSYTREDVTTHEAEYRLWDKVAALKQIGEHLGMFVKRHELSGKPGGEGIPFTLDLGAAKIVTG